MTDAVTAPRLRADTVSWNRTTGEVRATGNVAVVNPSGDTAYADAATLTDKGDRTVGVELVLKARAP